jgi:ketosteroid isomerase-like protein
MSTEKNVQTVKDFFAAIGRGDSEGLLALVAKTSSGSSRARTDRWPERATDSRGSPPRTPRVRRMPYRKQP